LFIEGETAGYQAHFEACFFSVFYYVKYVWSHQWFSAAYAKPRCAKIVDFIDNLVSGFGV
jgi:hypothetical protein